MIPHYALFDALISKTELYVASFDLFGDGHPVSVLDVRELACGPEPKADVKISRLFVLNKSMTHIDQELQDEIKGWYNNTTVELFRGEPNLESYGPDEWVKLFSGTGELYISQFHDSVIDNVCIFDFDPAVKTR
jgi:hypothetical protein